MSYGKHTIKEIRQYYLELRKNYTVELQKSPKGNLTCSNDYGRSQYYVLEKKKGGYIKHGINRNPDIIKRLARKKFLECSLKEIEQNIDLLNRVLNEFRDCDPTTIVNSMSKAYQKLSLDMFFNAEAEFDEFFYSEDELAKARYERHRRWAEAPYKKSNYREKDLTEVTSRGELVRTKSEVLVSELLYKNLVPFRYEDASNFDIYGVLPDFSFEKRDLSLMYLEYCGMMDNAEYVENFLRKRRIYEDYGIYEWKKIIYVYESGNRINMAMIDAIIKNQILPYL